MEFNWFEGKFFNRSYFSVNPLIESSEWESLKNQKYIFWIKNEISWSLGVDAILKKILCYFTEKKIWKGKGRCFINLKDDVNKPKPLE